MKAYIKKNDLKPFSKLVNGGDTTGFAPYANFDELLEALDIVIADSGRKNIPIAEEARSLNSDQFQLLIDLIRLPKKFLRESDLVELVNSLSSRELSETYKPHFLHNLKVLATFGYLTLENDEQGFGCTIHPLCKISPRGNKKRKLVKAQKDDSSQESQNKPKKEPKKSKVKKTKVEQEANDSNDSHISSSSSQASSEIENLTAENLQLKMKYEELKQLFCVRENIHQNDKAAAASLFLNYMELFKMNKEQEQRQLVSQLAILQGRLRKLENLQDELFHDMNESAATFLEVASLSSVSSSDLTEGPNEHNSLSDEELNSFLQSSDTNSSSASSLMPRTSLQGIFGSRSPNPANLMLSFSPRVGSLPTKTQEMLPFESGLSLLDHSEEEGQSLSFSL